MDEESREDFFRLKRVTDKKRIEKAKALYEAEKAGLKMTGGEEESDSIFGNQQQEEEDVIFWYLVYRSVNYHEYIHTLLKHRI